MTVPHTHLPSDSCPVCDCEFNAAAALDGEHVPPSPGDLTICIECGVVLAFDADLKVQPAEPGWRNTLPRDVLIHLDLAQADIRARNNSRMN